MTNFLKTYLKELLLIIISILFLIQAMGIINIIPTEPIISIFGLPNLSDPESVLQFTAIPFIIFGIIAIFLIVGSLIFGGAPEDEFTKKFSFLINKVQGIVDFATAGIFALISLIGFFYFHPTLNRLVSFFIFCFLIMLLIIKQIRKGKLGDFEAFIPQIGCILLIILGILIGMYFQNKI